MKTVRTIFLSLVWPILVILPSPLSRTEPTLRHFYVYNECHKPISSKLTYVPVGSEVSNTIEVAIDAGYQKMLGTTYKDTVVTESSSDDRTLHWESLKFSLTGSGPDNEYTHVIACNCPKDDSKCKLPDKWPNASSRQYPDGTSAHKSLWLPKTSSALKIPKMFCVKASSVVWFSAKQGQVRD